MRVHIFLTLLENSILLIFMVLRKLETLRTNQQEVAPETQKSTQIFELRDFSFKMFVRYNSGNKLYIREHKNLFQVDIRKILKRIRFFASFYNALDTNKN